MCPASAASESLAPIPVSPNDVFASAPHTELPLNPQFKILRDSPLFAPARDVLRDLSARYDHCRCLVDRLRTPAFESALFDVLLFAMFSAAGHRISLRRRHPRLLISKDGWTAAVDTVAPTPSFTNGAGRSVVSGRSAGLGGALFRKLREHPWRLHDTAGRPLVLAVKDTYGGSDADAAVPRAMLHFLFGAVQGLKSEGGADQEMARLFPNGFFGQVEAENISAILLCVDSGTLAKFNRIGQEGPHRTDTVKILRHGRCQGLDGSNAAATPFLYEVGSRQDAHESWNEGTMLIHNPSARHPIPRGWLGAGAEVDMTDGHAVCTFSNAFHPLASITETMPGDTPAWWMEMRANLITREMTAHPK